MNGDLAFIDALVTGPGVFNLQTPVVWVLEVKGKAGIGAVGLHTNCQKMQLLLVSSHPRYLQKRKHYFSWRFGILNAEKIN